MCTTPKPPQNPLQKSELQCGSSKYLAGTLLFAPPKISHHNYSFVLYVPKGSNNQVICEDDIFTLYSLYTKQL